MRTLHNNGLNVSLLFVWIAMPHVSASEMTYIVSSGALNSTHSLTPCHMFYACHHFMAITVELDIIHSLFG